MCKFCFWPLYALLVVLVFAVDHKGAREELCNENNLKPSLTSSGLKKIKSSHNIITVI